MSGLCGCAQAPEQVPAYRKPLHEAHARLVAVLESCCSSFVPIHEAAPVEHLLKRAPRDKKAFPNPNSWDFAAAGGFIRGIAANPQGVGGLGDREGLSTSR